jgi:hypothetical protein
MELGVHLGHKLNGCGFTAFFFFISVYESKYIHAKYRQNPKISIIGYRIDQVLQGIIVWFDQVLQGIIVWFVPLPTSIITFRLRWFSKTVEESDTQLRFTFHAWYIFFPFPSPLFDLSRIPGWNPSTSVKEGMMDEWFGLPLKYS